MYVHVGVHRCSATMAYLQNKHIFLSHLAVAGRDGGERRGKWDKERERGKGKRSNEGGGERHVLYTYMHNKLQWTTASPIPRPVPGLGMGLAKYMKYHTTRVICLPKGWEWRQSAHGVTWYTCTVK